MLKILKFHSDFLGRGEFQNIDTHVPKFKTLYFKRHWNLFLEVQF